MDADFSVELGADDAALEFPWTSDDERLCYFDLKSQPELLLYVDEATQYRELGEFLAVVNSPGAAFLTAKCDVWTEAELNEEEEIYGAAMKFCSYIDLLFDDNAGEQRFDFSRHQRIARRLAEMLNKAPQISVAAEFIVRRCYFHTPAGEGLDEGRDGFYLTFYLFGYGDDEEEARQRWGIGLVLVQNAILQLTAETRRERE